MMKCKTPVVVKNEKVRHEGDEGGGKEQGLRGGAGRGGREGEEKLKRKKDGVRDERGNGEKERQTRT
jgi:hypothetical protein